MAKRASKCDQHFCKLFPLSSVKFSLPVFEFLGKKVEEDLNLRNLNFKLTLRGKNLLDSGEVFSCLIAQLVKLVTSISLVNWEKEPVAVNKQLFKRNYEHETSLKGTNGESQITLRALVPPKTKAFCESE